MPCFPNICLKLFVRRETFRKGAALPVDKVVTVTGKAPTFGVLLRAIGETGASVRLEWVEMRNTGRFAGWQSGEENSGEDDTKRFHSLAY